MIIYHKIWMWETDVKKITVQPNFADIISINLFFSIFKMYAKSDNLP